MHNLLLKPANLLIIRHAESERNVGKKGTFYTEEERQNLFGATNPQIKLTENGRGQAFQAGQLLKKHFEHLDMIIHSGYQRTIETMEGITQAYQETTDDLRLYMHQPPIIVQDVAIRERDAGYGYHMTREEMLRHFPFNEEIWAQNDHFFTRPVGGESMAEVALRLDTFFTRLATLCEGKNILLVSHGRTINIMRFLLESKPLKDMQPLPGDIKNAQILHYRYIPDMKRLILQKELA
jgi:broad specificity phosphatase PhoE